LRTERPLDSIDWKILRELQQDSRLSFNELGRRVGLSSPAAAERVRTLEDTGVITGYGARVDRAKVGLPLLAFIQLRCNPGKCLLEHGRAEEFPEIVEMHKLSGAHCSLLKVAVSSMQHLEAFNGRLGARGSLISYVVTSSVLTCHIIDWEHSTVETQPPKITGWNDK
jgi:Lrp/AsnC family transcriptional regulator, leucine-responsive regulatory protein